MSTKGKHTRSPGYRPGNHWVVCDRCGFDVRSQDAKETWDGLVVCSEDYEPRHPQDFVRGTADKIAATGLIRPRPEDINILRCARSAIAGVAIAGCAVSGYTEDSIPQGTFNNSL